MQLYIDPGTGSMLFTVLVGVPGAAIYGLRTLIVKMELVLSGCKQELTGLFQSTGIHDSFPLHRSGPQHLPPRVSVHDNIWDSANWEIPSRGESQTGLPQIPGPFLCKKKGVAKCNTP